jgi:hypothetical protein
MPSRTLKNVVTAEISVECGYRLETFTVENYLGSSFVGFFPSFTAIALAGSMRNELNFGLACASCFKDIGSKLRISFQEQL